MGATYDDETVRDRSGHHRRHWTTIVLEERTGGGWRATQTGISVEGVGETAADAAAAYCRKISGTGDE